MLYFVSLAVDFFMCFPYMRLSCGCYHCSQAGEIDRGSTPGAISVRMVGVGVLILSLSCVFILLAFLILPFPPASLFSFLACFLSCPHPPSPPPLTSVFLKAIPPAEERSIVSTRAGPLGVNMLMCVISAGVLITRQSLLHAQPFVF